VSTEAKEDKSSTGHVWAAGFHHVTVRSLLERVLKLMNRLFLYSSNFILGRGKPRILNQCILGHACTSVYGGTTVTFIQPVVIIIHRLAIFQFCVVTP
jgi:hypothetical protein